MDEKQPRTKDQEIRIEAEKQVSEGMYSNYAMVAHSPDEFFIDFIFIHPHQSPDDPKLGTLRARIITSPQHMLRIQAAIGENLRKYEERFGKITERKAAGGTNETTRMQ